MGSSKKQTVGYEYYLGMHQILVHGPVDCMINYTVDGRVAWSGRSTGGNIFVNSRNLFGGESREGGVEGVMNLEMGKPDQGINDYLASKLGGILPAFRGVVGIVMRQMYLGNNPYLKKNAFRLQRIHVRQDGITQWYDEKAEIASATNAIISGPWQYQVIPYHADPGYNNLAIPSSGWQGEEELPFDSDHVWVYPTPPGWPTPNLSICWVKKTLYNVPAGLIIQLRADNGCVMFVNGEFVGASNRDNANIPNNQNNPVNFTVPSTGTYEIAGKAFSEATTTGQAGNILDITLDALPPGGDMNPAHIIRECLTDPTWGMGYFDEDIDDPSFIKAADQLWNEGMGMSLLWDRQMPMEQFIQEVVKHINAALYVGRSGDSAGKFVLKLIRGDYDEEELLHFDESSIERFDNFKRVEFGELTNSVTVNYWDSFNGKTASTTAQDSALIQQQGAVINTTMQYPGFTNEGIANRVALRDLLSLSTPLASGVIYVYPGNGAEELNIGDVIAVSWEDYGLVRLPMRISAMTLGDGKTNKIKLTLTQDVFGMPEFGVVVPPDIGWEDPNQPPIPLSREYAEEMPYYEMVQQFSQSVVDTQLSAEPDLGAVVAAGSRAQQGAINARIVTNSGAGYEDVGAIDFCPSAMLDGEIDKGGAAPTQIIAIKDGIDISSVEVGSYARISSASGEEYVYIIAIDSSSMEVKRAVLDTVPLPHADGSLVMFSDPFIQADPTEYVASDVVGVKLLPVTGQGVLVESAANEHEVTLDSRAIRPYPAASWQMNGAYWPENFASPISNTWVDRNRTQQTAPELVGWYDGNVTVEPGVTYNMRLYDGVGTLLTETVGVTSPYVLTPPGGGVFTMELVSLRDGRENFYKLQHTFEYITDAVFVVLPLTYDEEDAEGSMTWTRQGASPHVTPFGFEGNGWNAMMKSTTIPSWMSLASLQLSILAGVYFYNQRPMNSNGDTALFVGANASGVTPSAKLSLKVIGDPVNAWKSYLALQANTGTVQTLPLTRPEWNFVSQFPELMVGANQARPQGIMFLDSTTLLVSAHYQDTETRVYRINLTDMSVTGMFSFGTTTHRHIASWAKNAAGDVWCVDYDTGRTFKIDLAASFSSGSAVILVDWNTSILNKVSGIDFITVSGTEYVLIAEYSTSGTPYLYVIPAASMSGAFAVAGRYKRFNAGRRTQGIVVKDGNLWMAKNVDMATTTVYGWMERYNGISAIISGSADGSTLTPNFSMAGPSQYVEDIKFHPVTGEMWTQTEGWTSVGSHEGFLSIWKSPVNGLPVQNNVEAAYDGAGTVTVKINNRLFQTVAWTPTQDVAAVSVGGPPNVAAGFSSGYFCGFIKNVRIQNQPLEQDEYDDTVSGSYEPNSLTAYNVTVVNGGAETGDSTGWTDEVGAITARSLNPTPFEGSYYFNGGANAQTISRQRFSLATVTGLSNAEIDAGNIWAKLRWAQAAYTNQDPVTMGIRMLDGTPAQMSLTYGNLNWVPDGNSGVTPNWRQIAHGVDIPSGARNVDAVYRNDRNSGTNNDGYIDSITMVVYRK